MDPLTIGLIVLGVGAAAYFATQGSSAPGAPPAIPPGEALVPPADETASTDSLMMGEAPQWTPPVLVKRLNVSPSPVLTRKINVPLVAPATQSLADKLKNATPAGGRGI